MLNKTCVVCKKIFKTYNSNQKTCSIKCRNKSDWKKRCGRYKREGEKNPRWKGGVSRGYILKKAKEGLKFKNKLNICNICKKKIIKRIVIHHKNKNQQDNSFNNLLVLCDSCHLKEHYKDGTRKPLNRRDKKGRFIKNVESKG